MLFYTAGQSRVFFVMMYAGIAIGLYLSVDQALRRLFQAGRFLSLVMDLAFGLAAAFTVICTLLFASGGELRLYALMGALCGYLLYAATLGPLLHCLARALTKPVHAVGRWLNRRIFFQKFFK